GGVGRAAALGGRRAPGPRGVGQEAPRDLQVHSRQRHRPPEPVPPLGPGAMDQAWEVERRALLLAAAGIRDEEGAPTEERDEREVALPGDPAERAVEHPVET